MDSLHSECQALRSDNQDLRGTVNYLAETCDYMENQSRRNNLVFTGFASVTEGFESWEDCESKVKACVKEGMDIAVLEMERTHRVGKAIGVRFFLQTEDDGTDKRAQTEDRQRLRQHLRQRRLFGDSSEEMSSIADSTERTEAEGPRR